MHISTLDPKFYLGSHLAPKFYFVLLISGAPKAPKWIAQPNGLGPVQE
jgi:hypothetical protein